MRKVLILTLLLCSLSAFAQNWTAALPHVTSVPVNPPSNNGSWIKLHTTSGRFYQWNPNTLAWVVLAQGIDKVLGSVPPAYTPSYQQSEFAINDVDSLYRYRSGAWRHLNPGGGGGGTVTTDATLDGDGSGGDPLKIAQQSASTSEVLMWTGATWEPSWGNPFIFVTTGATITTAVNEILIGTIAANVTMGLPTCDATTDGKHFKFVRNGTDAFSVTIDPGGSQTFYDGTDKKIQYGKLSIDCTCRFSGGTGVWFFDNN